LRRQTGSSARAKRRLLRWLDDCEAKEGDAFAGAYRRRTGRALPHLTAGASVQRYGG
jgi:hypothetical protein